VGDPSAESGELLAAGPVNLSFKYIAARDLNFHRLPLIQFMKRLSPVT